MTRAGSLKITTPSDRAIAMTRTFDAKRDLVWEALTKPDLLKRWLGCQGGWRLEVCEVDLRVGGAYRWVWHGPDGVQMGMGGVFREITPPERIVATESFDTAWYPGNNAVVTQSLTETGGKTTLTLTVEYESREARDAVLASPMESGVSASYDKLEEVLASMT